MAQTSPYTAQIPTKVRSKKFWAFAIGLARPARHPADSRIVHTESQNRSTDPKNNGARTITTVVVQNWTDLNVTSQGPDCHRCDELRGVQFAPRTEMRAAFTLVTVFAVFDTVAVELLISNNSL
jgi:hypothetical protein